MARSTLEALLRHPAALPAAAALVFLGVALPGLGLPPVGAEELDETLRALHLLTTPADQVPSTWYTRESCLRVLGRYVPLMEDNAYVGAVECYLQLPLYAVLGRNALATRLLPVLLTAGALAAWVALARAWFGTAVAAITGLLVAVHPVLVFFARIGHYTDEVFTMGFFWVGAWLLHRAAAGDRDRALLRVAAGAFLLGLGFSHKITFLWLAAGGVAVAAATARTWLRPGILRARATWVGAGAFVAGALPLVVYNLRTGGATLRLMGRSLVEPTPKDLVDNLDLAGNLWIRTRQLLAGTVGGELWDIQYLPLLEGGHRTLYLLLASFLVALVAVPWLVRGELRRRVLLAWLFFGTVFLCSPFTVTTFRVSHLDVLYPFPQLAVALLVVVVARRVPARWGRFLAAGWVAVLAASSLHLAVDYHQRLRERMPSRSSPWETLHPGPDLHHIPKGRHRANPQRKPDRW